MPLSPEIIAALDRLRRPGKGPKQLHFDARRGNLDVSMRDVHEYFRDEVDDKGRGQLHQEMPYKGRSAAEGPGSRWQADLALYSRKQGPYVGFLLVVDVFTRLLDAEPIESKRATAVARAFDAIVRRFRDDNPDSRDPLDGLILTTDAGTEFEGAFRDYLVRHGGVWRARPPGSKNDIAVLDRAMGQLKKELRELTIDNATTNWVPFLPDVVENWNASYNEAIHGTPLDVEDNDTVQFLNMQDNARKFAHNHENEARMEEAVMRHGRFRPPVQHREGFRNRIFSRRFAAPRQAQRWESGVVVDTEGKEHTLKLVQPLGRDRRQEPEADPPPGLQRGRFRGLRRALRGEPPRPRRGPRPGGRGVDVAVDLKEPAPARQQVVELPVDPDERQALLRRYRGLLVKARFRALSDADEAFVRTWEAVMPRTDHLLRRAEAEAEAAKAELRGPGRPR